MVNNLRKSWLLLRAYNPLHFSLDLQLVSRSLVFRVQVDGLFQNQTILENLHVDSIEHFEESQIQVHLVLNL